MSQSNGGKLFCPAHGDYDPPMGETACPQCSNDPIRSRASLRAVKIVSASDTPPVDNESIDPADALTEIAERAPCPSCGKATVLDRFQTEALGEVWGGEAALWAEEGVCRDCYADVIPLHLKRWSSADWLAHHFEGWSAQVRRVSEVLEYTDAEQDAWLPEGERNKILDVEATLAARREHLARAQMRLREIKAELNLTDVPREFAAVLEVGRRSLEPAAVAVLKREREAGLAFERVRREDSVAVLSPVAELWRAPDDAPPWGTSAAAPVPRPFARAPRARWVLRLLAAGAVLAALAWWLLRS